MRKIKDLKRYGLPDTLLQIWGRVQGESLLPVQEAAVFRYGLFQGRSLVISSPTSSGKTFVGEMAALKAAFEGNKILYLVPLRALAEEKYRSFCERYAPYGVKVVIATRDRREFDASLERGDFHIAVLVYEKLSQMLVRHASLLKVVSLVVVDELQMLGDPERGPGLELSLVKLLASPTRPQLLGLSAVLREAEQVAGWLGAELVFQEERPVELHRGVLLNGRFRYRTYNTAEEGEEEMIDTGSDDPAEVMLSNVKQLAEKGEQVLVFLKAKRDAVDAALRLARELTLPAAKGALAELEGFEETLLKAQLAGCLAAGVAFHHADLTREERGLVETYYRGGEIRVIACTTTLAFGVNLPASTVFLEPVKWAYDRRTNAAVELPISWSDYENIAGRAGRLGFQEEFGRAVVIAVNPFQADLLWRSYIEREGEEFLPVPAGENLVDRVLNLAASRLCPTRDEVCAFLGRSYLVFVNGGETGSLEADADRALGLLVRHQLVRKGEGGALEATSLGEVAARKGITALTAVGIARFLESAREREVPDLEVLHFLGLTAEARRLAVPLSSQEHRSRVYESLVKDALGERTDVLGEELARMIDPRLMPTVQEAKALKVALLLAAWIQADPLAEVERNYHCYAGTLQTLSEEMSWLADAASAIAEVVGCPAQTRSRLSELSDRLQFGVEARGLDLARLRLPGLGRDEIKALVQAGFDSPSALRETSPEVVRGVVPGWAGWPES